MTVILNGATPPTDAVVRRRHRAGGRAARRGRSPLALAGSGCAATGSAMISLVVIVLIVLVAVFAPLIAALTGHPRTSSTATPG